MSPFFTVFFFIARLPLDNLGHSEVDTHHGRVGRNIGNDKSEETWEESLRNKLLGQVDRHTGRKHGSKCGRSCTDRKKTSTELHAHTAWEEVADKKDWDNLGLTWRS